MKSYHFSTHAFALALLFCFVVSGSSVYAQDKSADEPSSEETESARERLKPKFVRPGADPWAIEYKGRYYWSQSNNPTRSIRLWVSDSLEEPGEYKDIWTAPRRGPYSRELWAPEIHYIDGRFYVYFAADNGDNKNHLTYVLVSENDDPYSEYHLEGPVYTGDDFDGKTQNRWAIDSTVFEHKGKRYLIWSGWKDDQDIQYLYVAPLADPPTQTAGARVLICDNADYLWERSQWSGLSDLFLRRELAADLQGRTHRIYRGRSPRSKVVEKISRPFLSKRRVPVWRRPWLLSCR